VDTSSALATRTTTCIQARVRWRTKGPGGTAAVTLPTWTAPTWEAVTRRTLTVWIGSTGRVITTLWDSLKWKSNLLMFELCDNVFLSFPDKYHEHSLVTKLMAVTPSLFQPERSLPERQSLILRWRCGVGSMEGCLLLFEIHWNEN